MTDCPCACHVHPSASCTVDSGESGVPGVAYCGAHGSDEQLEPRPLLTVGEMWDACDDLTNTTRRRLRRDNGASEWVQLPSLFDQLVEAMESGSESSGSHGAQESKPPLDSSALSLLITIADTVRSGCWNWRIKRSFDTPKDLRSVASAVVAHGDSSLVDQLARMVRSWCAQIRATISNEEDRSWRMHGAACRVCKSTTVPAYADDGAITRQPAMIVHSEDGVIHRVECSFCGSVLSGPDMTDIVAGALKQRARAAKTREVETA